MQKNAYNSFLLLLAFSFIKKMKKTIDKMEKVCYNSRNLEKKEDLNSTWTATVAAMRTVSL